MNKLQFFRPALSASALAFALLAVLPSHTVAGKTDVPVRISATTPGSPRASQPLTVTLSFHADKGGQPLSVRYSTEGAVVLQSPASEQLSLDAEGRASTRVTLTPLADGQHFLNVFASVGGRTRAASVPLTVGSADLRRSSPQARSAAQPRAGFIEFEAVETVR